MKRLKIISGIGVILAVLLIVLTFILLKRLNVSLPLPGQATVDIKKASTDSYIESQNTNTVFNVFSGKESIYTSNKTGRDAAVDFLSQTDFLPKDFARNIEDRRSKEEPGGKQHFYFYQTINNIPVYGSNIAVHIKNGNQIYAAEGNVLKDETLGDEVLTEQEAGPIALKQAQLDNPDTELSVIASEKVILNTKLLGLDNDGKNHVALAVEITSTVIGSEFDTIYFVGLEKGEILYSKSNIHDALQREVRNPQRCTNGQNVQSCQLQRNEGGQAIGDKDADNAFQQMGDVYSYFDSTFGQDSYDNQGGMITILPHIRLKKNGVMTTDCRNAYWSIQGHYMAICDNMVANDVLAHEFTHGITASTSNLEYMAQSGAINESLSDIMATAIDADWNIGEDTVLGVVRSMDNPPAKNFPDKLFSTLYGCPPSGVASKNYCNGSNDYCGVHKNSSILNKAFFLMVQGGTFSGCTMQGIGAEKAHAIAYRALTTYLTQISNFRDVYNSFVHSCEELYDETTCSEVKKALQATELDQQPIGTQTGPRCSGIAARAPTCAGGSQPTPGPTSASEPSSAVEPTQVSQVTATPTSAGGSVDMSGCEPKYKPDANGCEQPTLYTPNGVEGPGPVTFTWCASKPQQGFNFRLDVNSDNPGKPDVVQDRMPQTSITLNVPKGKHAWWVHTFCADGKNGYLSEASGRTLEVKELSNTTIKKGPVMTNTPTPYLSPTILPGGAQQRVLQ